MYDRRIVLQVEDLHVRFPVVGGLIPRKRREIRAVKGVSLTLNRGETLGLVGESGSGKTTVGRAIVNILRPMTHRVEIDGRILYHHSSGAVDLVAVGRRQMRRYRADLQMVFQDPYSSLNPRMTIGRIIEEPLELHTTASAAERRERVHWLLEKVRLSPAVAERYPHEFSGGHLANVRHRSRIKDGDLRPNYELRVPGAAPAGRLLAYRHQRGGSILTSRVAAYEPAPRPCGRDSDRPALQLVHHRRAHHVFTCRPFPRYAARVGVGHHLGCGGPDGRTVLRHAARARAVARGGGEAPRPARPIHHALCPRRYRQYRERGEQREDGVPGCCRRSDCEPGDRFRQHCRGVAARLDTGQWQHWRRSGDAGMARLD